MVKVQHNSCGVWVSQWRST